MPTAHTRTGKFGIGYRWIGSDWQKNNFDKTLEWTASNGFTTIDVPPDFNKDLGKFAKHGLKVCSVDLAGCGGYQALITSDKAKRAEAVKKTTAIIEEAAAGGAKVFFTLMIPEDPSLPRGETYKYMIEAYQPLVATAEKAGTKIVIEGWPGFNALCCTPETYRAALRDIPSPALAINYDASHLIRMGIDPVRFVTEFASRVGHVHGKDTELFADALYEYGSEQPAAFKNGFGFGGFAWRYTIPGHGSAPFIRIFEILSKAGFKGFVSVELEDQNFNGSEQGEKLGLVKSREYLEGC